MSENKHKQQEEASGALRASASSDWRPTIVPPGWLIRGKFPQDQDGGRGDWRIEYDRLTGQIWDAFRAKLNNGHYSALTAQRVTFNEKIKKSFAHYDTLVDEMSGLIKQRGLATLLLEPTVPGDLSSSPFQPEDPASSIDLDDYFYLSGLLDKEEIQDLGSDISGITVGQLCARLINPERIRGLKKQMDDGQLERETLAFRESILDSILDYEDRFGSPPEWSALQKAGITERSEDSRKLEKYLGSVGARTRNSLVLRLEILGGILQRKKYTPDKKFRARFKKSYYTAIEEQQFRDSDKLEPSNNKQPGNTAGKFIEKHLKNAGLPIPKEIPKDFTILCEDFRQIPEVDL